MALQNAKKLYYKPNETLTNTSPKQPTELNM